jgi:hypothetical protein
VTFGAGFGSPSPVMGFASFVAPCADNVVAPLPESIEAVKTTTTQAPNVESRIRIGMAPPREFEQKRKSSAFLTRDYRSSARELTAGAEQELLAYDRSAICRS